MMATTCSAIRLNGRPATADDCRRSVGGMFGRLEAGRGEHGDVVVAVMPRGETLRFGGDAGGVDVIYRRGEGPLWALDGDIASGDADAMILRFVNRCDWLTDQHTWRKLPAARDIRPARRWGRVTRNRTIAVAMLVVIPLAFL